MKTHITNIYGVIRKGNYLEQVNYLAECGRALGFLEMGIYRYPVNTDTSGELSKRLDGIISSVEPEDIVFLQLPTGNGIEYERLLIQKIKQIKDTRVILILHNENKYDNYNFSGSDACIAQNQLILDQAQQKNRFMYSLVHDLSLMQTKYAIQQVFAQAMEYFVFENQNRRLCKEYMTQKDTIHVGFSLHDKVGRYSSFVGAAMESILRCTESKLCFHILHDETVNERNKLFLVATGGRRGAAVCLHLIDKEKVEADNPWIEQYSIGSMFRLLLPEVLPELHKVIYLDADIMFCRDITELWNMELGQNTIAAVPDVGIAEKGINANIISKRNLLKKEQYFNSGVLVLDLDRIREQGNLAQITIDLLKEIPESTMPDQDALNVLYREKTLLLEPIWNVATRFEREENQELREVVYHYMGEGDIVFSKVTAFDRLYCEIRQSLPWGYETIEDSFFRGIASAYYKVQMLQKLICQIASKDKKIIYYGMHMLSVDNMQEIIQMRPGDYWVGDKYISQGYREWRGFPIKPFSELEKEERGTFVVLVLPDADNGEAIQKLGNSGLIMGVDFFVIPSLLTANQGGYRV